MLSKKTVIWGCGVILLSAFLAGAYSGWKQRQLAPHPVVQFGISVRNGDVGKQLRDARQLSGMPVGLVALDFFWDDDFPFEAVQFVSSKRAVPVIRWYPMMSDSLDPFSFQAILEGTWDAHIQRWAQRAKESQYPMVIALFSDFNREEMGLEGVDEQSQQFVASMRYIIDMFKKENVHNVTWVWQVSNDPMVVLPSNLHLFFPGKEYVDFVGISMAYTPVVGFADDFNTLVDGAIPSSNSKPVFLTVMDVRPFPEQLTWMSSGVSSVLASSNVALKALVLDVPEGFPYQKLQTVFKVL